MAVLSTGYFFLVYDVAWVRPFGIRHGVQTPTEHQKAVGALGNQTHLTGCVTTSQTPYEQQKMPEIRFSPSFPPFTAPLKEVNWS